MMKLNIQGWLNKIKADKDLSNVTAAAGASLNYVGVRTVVETLSSGQNYMRIWSDGFKEQWGVCDNGGSAYNEQKYTIYFMRPFVDTSYCFVENQNAQSFDANVFYMRWIQAIEKTTTSIAVWSISLGGTGANIGNQMYYCCGY